jgi:hypothetical protein
MYKRVATISALTASIILFGCAGFRENNLKDVSKNDIQISNTEKVKVFSRWSIENAPSANEQAKAAGSAVTKKNFESALTESNCCIIVEGPTEADIIVDGKAYNENNMAAVIPAFITGLTLYVIPSWVTGTTHISAKVSAKKDVGNYDLRDSMTMVQWLPMIFVMPFKGSPLTTGKEVDANVYRTLVLKMKNEGYLSRT